MKLTNQMIKLEVLNIFDRDQGTIVQTIFICKHVCVPGFGTLIVMYEPDDVRDMCEGTQEKDMEN